MSKRLFQQESPQQISVALPCTNKNNQKKNRPKFTILDDIEQLNQIINGPGANEQNQRTQQMLQKTYQYMKGHENENSQKSPQLPNPKSNTPHENQQQNERQHLQPNKQNKNYSNISKSQTSISIQQKMKHIRGPRIVVTLRKIDLMKEPSPNQFYVKGLENLISSEETFGGTRAPRNSMLESQTNADGNLFAIALETERNKNCMVGFGNKNCRQNMNYFLRK